MLLITRRYALLGLSAVAAGPALALTPTQVPILLGTPPIARRLLAGEPQGMAISFVDGSMVIRDTTTPANNFDGKYTSKLTITGSLPWGPSGAAFDGSNYASLAAGAFPSPRVTGAFVMDASNTLGAGFPDLITMYTTGDQTDAVLIYGNNGANWRFNISSGSVNQADIDSGVGQASGSHKFAFAWQANDAAGVIDGGTPATDATVTVPVSLTTLVLGNNGAGTNNITGKIKSLVVLPRRLSNTEMQAKTA